MKQRTLKLQRIYKEGSAYLESRPDTDAQIDAWYLLEYVTGISRASYYGNPEKNISEGSKTVLGISGKSVHEEFTSAYYGKSGVYGI